MGISKTMPLLLFACFLSITDVHIVLAQKSTYIVHMDKSFMPKVFTNHNSWYTSLIDSTKSFGQTSDHHSAPELLYTYDNALHGFSALMSKDELEVVKKSPGFISAYIDKAGAAEIDTTHSIDFLNLNTVSGLWPAAQYGKDVIIAVIDGGIWPEHPSFKDDGMTKIPEKWKGICQEGEEFNSSLCNLKLIGARYFNKAVQAANPNEVVAMNSARDEDGHGTHCAATAAGNYVKGASFFGYASGTARGVAPRARLAAYKVLWSLGNMASDIIAGIDQAVADGVDVISISLGFGFAPLYEESLSIASFGAMAKGVFVSLSAGNRGPDLGSLHNGFPWALTVAAGTVDRWFAGNLILGNGVTITGWSMFPGRAWVRNSGLIYNETLSACNPDESFSESEFSFGTSIVICNSTESSFRDQMLFISRINPRGAIFVSDDPSIFRSNFFPEPGVVISPKDAEAVINYGSNVQFPTATINFQQTILGTKPVPAVSASSSRGPSRNYLGISKPDIMAPGVLILAATIPNGITANIGSNIVLSNDYDAISGTSMACPHAAGIAALLKSAHPEWSPSAIRSAMMTTASTIDNTGSPIKDTGFDNQIATPLAIGAGHVDPNRALDPGLIYDATPQDYVNLVCSLNFTQNETLSITRLVSYNCSSPSSDLNYPSFIALYDIIIDGSSRKYVRKFLRTVTNVGDGAAAYKAEFIAPKGSSVKISPKTLRFAKKNEKKSYSMEIQYRSDENQTITFGSLTWVEENGNKHIVRSPIAVAPAIETW